MNEHTVADEIKQTPFCASRAARETLQTFRDCPITTAGPGSSALAADADLWFSAI